MEILEIVQPMVLSISFAMAGALLLTLTLSPDLAGIILRPVKARDTLPNAAILLLSGRITSVGPTRDSLANGRRPGGETYTTCLLRILVFSAILPAMSSCAWISSHAAAPDVHIEKVSNRSARVVSANFWRDGGQLSLRGEVVSNPVSKSVLRGHLDIEIISPDGTKVACLTTKPRMRVRHVRKPYSVALRTLPDPGSTVRIRHHLGANHADCVSYDDSSTRAQPVPDVM